MQYDFSQEINRRGTHSIKWGFMQDEEDPLRAKPTEAFFGENRILPLWVADMDFASPRPVVEALIERAEHGIYGYTGKTDSYCEAVVNWMRKRHGWEIAPEWICTTPGVVPALNMLVRAFVAPGERVLIQRPVYYPFFGAIENNGAEMVVNPLVYENGRYRMDFGDLEEKARDPRVRLAILCSPHNPVGRVWTADELTRFGEICLKNDVLIVSDEIHGDLIYRGNKFVPLARLGEAFAQNAITCTAPSKTFNLAGLHTSNIIISNPELRGRFEKTLQSNGLFGINAFGVVAVEAAYNHGEEWLAQVLDYLEGNLRYLEDYVSGRIPQVTVIRPEGTYLVWIDCRRLGLDKDGLKRLMLKEARVYLDEGFLFGPEGEGFERINIACPR
ncbi:MAG: cystathionine beta-lyase, partial [Anaerolineales bacterium]|nr:cystathionine beta-lyase [Anaerolineales bacterium]